MRKVSLHSHASGSAMLRSALARVSASSRAAVARRSPFGPPVVGLLTAAPRTFANNVRRTSDGELQSWHRGYAVRARAVAQERVGASEVPEEQSKSVPSFASTALGEGLLHAMELNGFTEPTEIQLKSIPAVMTKGDVLIASHTGSGKTLAYLLPIIQMLKNEEEAAGQMITRPKRPRVLVLGPTRELTDQVLSVAKSLSHSAKISSTGVNGGISLSQGKTALSYPVDILVGTPQRVMQHHKDGHLFFGDVKYIVLDEADTMFDAGFGKEVRQLLQPVRNKEDPASAVLVTATLTKDVQKLLNSEFPSMKRVDTSSLHRATSTARHDFHTVPPGRDKLGYLYELIQAPVRKGKRMIVFCNTMDSARAVEHFLAERAMASVCYHGDVPLAEREAAMKSFLNGDEAGRQPVMVCTDLAARGLDFKTGVDQVMNFDFPRTVVDYIHRTGRTARAGKVGFVSSIIDVKSSTLAKRVKFAVERGLPLDEINANPQSLPPSMRPSEKMREKKRIEQKEGVRKGVRGAARFEKSVPPKGKSTGQKGRGSGPSSGGGRGGPGRGRGGRGRGAAAASPVSGGRGGRGGRR